MATDPTDDAARIAKKLAALQNEVPVDELERRLLNAFTPKELTAEDLEQIPLDWTYVTPLDWTYVTPEDWDAIDEEDKRTAFMAQVQHIAHIEKTLPRFNMTQYDELTSDSRRVEFVKLWQVREERDARMLDSIGIDGAQLAASTVEEQCAMINAAREAHARKTRELIQGLEQVIEQGPLIDRILRKRALERLYSDKSVKTRVDLIDFAITHLGQAINAFRAADARDIERRCIAFFDELAWEHGVKLPGFPTFRRYIDFEWRAATAKLPPDECKPVNFKHRLNDAREKLDNLLERVGKDKGLELVSTWLSIQDQAINHAVSSQDADASENDGNGAADPPVDSATKRR